MAARKKIHMIATREFLKDAESLLSQLDNEEIVKTFKSKHWFCLGEKRGVLDVSNLEDNYFELLANFNRVIEVLKTIPGGRSKTQRLNVAMVAKVLLEARVNKHLQYKKYLLGAEIFINLKRPLKSIEMIEDLLKLSPNKHDDQNIDNLLEKIKIKNNNKIILAIKNLQRKIKILGKTPGILFIYENSTVTINSREKLDNKREIKRVIELHKLDYLIIKTKRSTQIWDEENMLAPGTMCTMHLPSRNYKYIVAMVKAQGDRMTLEKNMHPRAWKTIENNLSDARRITDENGSKGPLIVDGRRGSLCLMPSKRVGFYQAY